jgi:WD40 repeat protein
MKVHRTADGAPVHSYEGHTGHVLGVAWHADGALLASCGADNVVKIWNAETGDQQRTIGGFGKEITAVTFAGDSTEVLTACGDRTARRHRSDNGGNVRSYGGATDFLSVVAASADGNVVIAGGADSTLRVYIGPSGQMKHALPPPGPPESPKQAMR